MDAPEPVPARLHDTSPPTAERDRDDDDDGGGGGGGGGDLTAGRTDWMNAMQLTTIFAYLDGYSIARLARVSRHWRALARHPIVFHRACRYARVDMPPHLDRPSLLQIDWRQRFVSVARVRFDGVYCLRVRYWVDGSASRQYAPLDVSYYRYVRFFRDGRVWYSLSNRAPDRFLRELHESRRDRIADNAIFEGRYAHAKATTTIVVAMKHMIAGIKVRLWSTEPGANNRLKLLALSSLTSDLDVAHHFPVPAQQFAFHRVDW